QCTRYLYRLYTSKNKSLTPSVKRMFRYFNFREFYQNLREIEPIYFLTNNQDCMRECQITMHINNNMESNHDRRTVTVFMRNMNINCPSAYEFNNTAKLANSCQTLNNIA
ncbi:hypothetical protein L9F63_002503, partial [Diploptera punctata]